MRRHMFVVVAAACGGGNGSHPDAISIAYDAAPDAAPGSSFDDAIDVTSKLNLGGKVVATLPSPYVKAYYKATVSSDDVRLVSVAFTDAYMKPPGTVVNTVLTVYDSTETPIAQDDDSWAPSATDSTLWFQTRAAGTYYFTVEDCNSAGLSNCAAPGDITDLDYTFEVNHTNRVGARETTATSTQDGTIANAQSITYSVPNGGTAGNYGYYILDGSFAAAGATHVFAFTPPTDATLLTGTRERAEFWVQPTGASNGDGSTANIKLWVTAADGTTILARADESNYGNGDTHPNGPLNLTLPVTGGTLYYLFVQDAAATSTPATDYYYVAHFIGSYYVYTAELEGATTTGTNDSVATAEICPHPMQYLSAYYIDGNLATAADVDWFEVDVPAGETYVDLFCFGARQGAGIGGMTAALYEPDGTTEIESIGPETAMQDAEHYIAVPSGTSRVFLKVSASSLDPTNTGTAYRCGVFYYAP